jgi:hypothetical protein
VLVKRMVQGRVIRRVPRLQTPPEVLHGPNPSAHSYAHAAVHHNTPTTPHQHNRPATPEAELHPLQGEETLRMTGTHWLAPRRASKRCPADADLLKKRAPHITAQAGAHQCSTTAHLVNSALAHLSGDSIAILHRPLIIQRHVVSSNFHDEASTVMDTVA